MVVAVIAGVVAGALSIVPFRVSTRKIRTVNPTHSLDMLAPFLLTIFASFLVLIAGMVACKLVAPDVIVPFLIAEILAFVIGIIVFVAIPAKRR